MCCSPNIEIVPLRELRRARREHYTAIHILDDPRSKPTNEVWWIDTDVMVADHLTNVMKNTELLESFTTLCLDIQQPVESAPEKRAKLLQRRKTSNR